MSTDAAALASPRPPLRAHLRAMAVGLALGLVATGFALLWDGRERLAFHAILIAWIGAVYLGFAIADGRRSSILVQVASALLFLNVGFYGFVWESQVLLGLGFVAHGLWDWLHHDDHGPTHVAGWYPPFCAVADVVIGVPLLAGWV